MIDESKAKEEPTTTRAAVFHGFEKPITVEHFALPRPRSSEILVAIECCTVCGSDLHTIAGKRQERTPTILGHEVCGRVLRQSIPPARDLDGKELEIGDRITWSVSIACGACDRCQNGTPQKCRTLSKFGHESVNGTWPLSGGYSEYATLPSRAAIVRIPDELPSTVAAMANCAVATIMAAVRIAGPLEGKRVLVFGAGLLGLVAAAIARTQTANTIVVCDPSLDRLKDISQFGADYGIHLSEEANCAKQILDRTGNSCFDVIIEASGSSAAVEAAVLCADVQGKILLVGSVMKSRPVPIDPEQLVRKLISIHGIHNYVPDDLRNAVIFLSRYGRQFPFAESVPQVFSLEQIESAIEFAISKRPVRVGIVPN